MCEVQNYFCAEIAATFRHIESGVRDSEAGRYPESKPRSRLYWFLIEKHRHPILGLLISILHRPDVGFHIDSNIRGRADICWKISEALHQ